MLLIVSKFTSLDIRFSLSEKIYVTESLNFVLDNFDTELVYKTNQKFRNIFYYEGKNLILNHSVDIYIKVSEEDFFDIRLIL